MSMLEEGSVFVLKITLLQVTHAALRKSFFSNYLFPFLLRIRAVAGQSTPPLLQAKHPATKNQAWPFKPQMQLLPEHQLA